MTSLAQFLPPAVAVALVGQYLLQQGRLGPKLLVIALFVLASWLQFAAPPFSPLSLAGLLLHILLALVLLIRQYARGA